jgi:hypothetical protein
LGRVVLGGGLEPPCLAAYAPQTYVSAISPPERVLRWNGKSWMVHVNQGAWVFKGGLPDSEPDRSDLFFTLRYQSRRTEIVDFNKSSSRSVGVADDDRSIRSRTQGYVYRRFKLIPAQNTSRIVLMRVP